MRQDGIFTSNQIRKTLPFLSMQNLKSDYCSCRFIESIRVFGGKAENLSYHQARVRDTFAHHFRNRKPVSLQQVIDDNPPPENGLFKLRIVYSETVEVAEYLPYLTPHFKIFRCFSVPDDFEYQFKSANRQLFDEISQKAGADVLPVLIRKGVVTDSTITNLIFKKRDQWFTPTSLLLQGVQLQKVTEAFPLHRIKIRETEIETFDAIYPINALNPLGSIAPILTKN